VRRIGRAITGAVKGVWKYLFGDVRHEKHGAKEGGE